MATDSDVNDAKVNMYVTVATLAETMTRVAEMVMEDYVESKRVNGENKMVSEARAATVAARGGR